MLGRPLLAHALGMRVVAERVNDAEQLRQLRSAGCDLVPGNLLGAPGPAAQLTAERSPLSTSPSPGVGDWVP